MDRFEPSEMVVRLLVSSIISTESVSDIGTLPSLPSSSPSFSRLSMKLVVRRTLLPGAPGVGGRCAAGVPRDGVAHDDPPSLVSIRAAAKARAGDWTMDEKCSRAAMAA